MAAGSPAIGEPPDEARPNRDMLIYLGALVAVPVVVFLFQNLMNASRRRNRARASSAISPRCR